MLIVQKYGGTSLGDEARVRLAAQRICNLIRQGQQVVAVVSAQGHTTDALIEKAERLCAGAHPREMDAYLATGEQQSAALMAMALEAMGCPAVSLTGWQAGIHTQPDHGNARIADICPGRIFRELEKGKAVIVAGFQGIAPNGDITTLGRGGSDTTAVALAAYLHADVCRIYTDVDGVYDKDPRKHADALRYTYISYEDMLALARSGAQVLHDRCVEIARNKKVVLEVCSAFSELPGTLVGPAQKPV